MDLNSPAASLFILRILFLRSHKPCKLSEFPEISTMCGRPREPHEETGTCGCVVRCQVGNKASWIFQLNPATSAVQPSWHQPMPLGSEELHNETWFSVWQDVTDMLITLTFEYTEILLYKMYHKIWNTSHEWEMIFLKRVTVIELSLKII